MSAVSEFEYRYNMSIKAFPSHAEPVFESASQKDLMWRVQWGCDSFVGR